LVKRTTKNYFNFKGTIWIINGQGSGGGLTKDYYQDLPEKTRLEPGLQD